MALAILVHIIMSKLTQKYQQWQKCLHFSASALQPAVTPSTSACLAASYNSVSHSSDRKCWHTRLKGCSTVLTYKEESSWQCLIFGREGSGFRGGEFQSTNNNTVKELKIHFSWCIIRVSRFSGMGMVEWSGEWNRGMDYWNGNNTYIAS